jgi:hypothetical protein
VTFIGADATEDEIQEFVRILMRVIQPKRKLLKKRAARNAKHQNPSKSRDDP